MKTDYFNLSNQNGFIYYFPATEKFIEMLLGWQQV